MKMRRLALTTCLYYEKYQRRRAKILYLLLHRLFRWNYYQPAPWLGIDEGHRAKATKDRWEVIRRVVEPLEPGCALDLGSQLGFFSLKMAEKGFIVLGVENDPHILQGSRLLCTASGICGVSYKRMIIDNQNVPSLPKADVTLFLSVWHHICRTRGEDYAREVLTKVLSRSRRVCFFETGQSDETYMEWARQLPDMGTDVQQWLTNLLMDSGARRVEHLGAFPAFRGSVRRHLFAAYMD